MISQEMLIQILIKGRFECYIRKSSSYNPYKKSVLYDWEFKTEINGFIFTDSYRGFNPYSGVEYVFLADNEIPIWSCDYLGYVIPEATISADKIYEFLKEARGVHLESCNGNLFSDFDYHNKVLKYKTYFQGDISALLQVENFYYGDKLIAQQMTSGRLKL